MADVRKLLADRFSGVVHNMDDGTETADMILRLFTEHDLVVVEGEYLADLQRSQGEARRLAGWKFERGDS